MPKGVQPFHLLWGLIFMKVYATEAVHCKIVNSPDEKTFRKWSLLFVKEISYLESEIVSLSVVFDFGMGLTHHCVFVLKDLP